MMSLATAECLSFFTVPVSKPQTGGKQRVTPELRLGITDCMELPTLTHVLLSVRRVGEGKDGPGQTVNPVQESKTDTAKLWAQFKKELTAIAKLCRRR